MGLSVQKILLPLFLGSTFVGMSDPKKINRFELLLSLIIYQLLFFFMFKPLSFLGGTLGTLAFVSTLIVYFFKKSGLTKTVSPL